MVQLNELRDNKGARYKSKRLSRGIAQARQAFQFKAELVFCQGFGGCIAQKGQDIQVQPAFILG